MRNVMFPKAILSFALAVTIGFSGAVPVLAFGDEAQGKESPADSMQRDSVEAEQEEAGQQPDGAATGSDGRASAASSGADASGSSADEVVQPRLLEAPSVQGDAVQSANPAPAAADDPSAAPAGGTGWSADRSRWYDGGAVARSHAFYDPGTDAWYWADADGSIASDKDVFIPRDEADRSAGGKWVRFDAQRRMVKGEDYRVHEGTASWYYFDPVTGEMAKGFAFIPSNGGKWVFYDRVTGRMLYGEQAIDGSWYYLTPGTGAVDYEWAWIPTSRKWVYYEPVTGKMVHGERSVSGVRCYFDRYTGQFQGPWNLFNVLVNVGNASYSFSLDKMVELNEHLASGGNVRHYVDPATYSASDDEYYQFADLRGYTGMTSDQVNRRIDSASGARQSTLRGQGQAVVEAAKAYGLNESYLLAHIALESAWGSSALASGGYRNGQVIGGVYYPAGKYYNYIGYGAYDNNPYIGGMNYAQMNNWNSPSAAIWGAAKILHDTYIYSDSYMGQFTLYDMRWNPAYVERYGKVSPHRYATATHWAASIGRLMSQNYKAAGMKPSLRFIVPSYR